MASGQSTLSGMQHYVKSHAAANDQRRGGNMSLEDLKYDLSENVQAADSRRKQSGRSDAARHAVQKHQPRVKREPDTKPPFYDTDSSSIGGTSTTPSALQVRQASHARCGYHADPLNLAEP